VNLEEIRIVIDEKRPIHPELNEPLRWNGLQRILARECVALARAPLDRPAQLVHFDGAWIITVNSDTPAARHTYFAAHEVGHLWLHVQRTGEPFVRCYHMDPEWRNDEHEDDAEAFALMVLGGPIQAIAENNETTERRIRRRRNEALADPPEAEALESLQPESTREGAVQSWPRLLTKRRYDQLTERIIRASSPEELAFLEENIRKYFHGAYMRDLVEWIEDRWRDFTGR
jgi:hypothetical protein